MSKTTWNPTVESQGKTISVAKVSNVTENTVFVKLKGTATGSRISVDFTQTLADLLRFKFPLGIPMIRFVNSGSTVDVDLSISWRPGPTGMTLLLDSTNPSIINDSNPILLGVSSAGLIAELANYSTEVGFDKIEHGLVTSTSYTHSLVFFESVQVTVNE